MPFIDDDEVVEAFLTHGANPAFRVSIGVRSANRCTDHFHVSGSKDPIKSRGEFGVPIME